MRTLWNKIAQIVARWRGRAAHGPARVEPRLICSCEVFWESQGLRGEGRLREVSSTGLRLYADRAVLAGRPIRVLPKPGDALDPLPLEVAQGVVLYSRSRKGRFEIGVRLGKQEKSSRHGWLHRLRRESDLPRIMATERPAVGDVPRLTICRSLKGIE